MMNYEARERWIRDRICIKNSEVMTAGADPYIDHIYIKGEPTLEMVKLGNNWEVELYEGNRDPKSWFVEIYEKSTEREFTIFIISQ